MSPDSRLLFAHLSRALARYVPEAAREARTMGTTMPAELLTLAEFFADCAQTRQDATSSALSLERAQPEGMADLMLTKREVASSLGLSVRQVERLIAARDLVAVCVGAAVRVRRSDLETYVANLAPKNFRDHITEKDTA